MPIVIPTLRSLALVSLAALSACVVEVDDPPPPSSASDDGPTGADPASDRAGAVAASGEAAQAPTFRSLSLTWKIQKADGAKDQCPANYSKLKVHASAISASDTRNGDAFVTVFDCNAGKATLRLQTSGDEAEQRTADGSLVKGTASAMTGKYSITMVITEPSGEVDFSATRSQVVDLSRGDASLAFVVTPGASHRRTAWGLKAKSTGDSLSCAASGADTIRVKSKRVQLPDQAPDPSPKETIQTFPCESEPSNVTCFGCAGAGTSTPLEYGYYATSIEALANGTVIGTLPYDDTGSLVRVDRESVRLLKNAGNPDSADVYMSSSFFLEVTNR